MSDHHINRRTLLRGSAIALGASIPMTCAHQADGQEGRAVADEDDIVFHKDIHTCNLMKGFPPARDQRVSVNNWYLTTDTVRWTNLNSEFVFQCAPIESSDFVWQLPRRAIDPGNLGRRTVRFGSDTRTNERKTVDEWLRICETDAFLVVHDGHIVTEQYFGDSMPNTRHHLWSAGRSYLAALLVSSLHHALDLNTDVSEYVPELAGSGFERASIRNLLDHTTDLNYHEFPNDSLADDVNKQLEWGTDAFATGSLPVNRMFRAAGCTQRMDSEDDVGYQDIIQTLTGGGRHGESFSYKDANSIALQLILERVGKASYYQQLGEFWRRLGSEYAASIMVDRSGVPVGSYGLSVTARDFARFGLMLCNHGLADIGVQFAGISDFVDDIQSNSIPHDWSKMLAPGYRGHFWSAATKDRDDRIFFAFGAYQQKCVVWPAQKLVVVQLASFWENDPRKKQQGYDQLTIDVGLWSLVNEVLPELLF